jgi:hypothetical protein
MKIKMFDILDKAKPNTGNKFNKLKLGGGHAYDRSIV